MVKIGASYNGKSGLITGQSLVCTQPLQPKLQQREMESSNYYTFLFNGWKTFLRSVLQQKEENADEFKQISTTLNYYTIVRKIHVS